MPYYASEINAKKVISAFIYIQNSRFLMGRFSFCPRILNRHLTAKLTSNLNSLYMGPNQKLKQI